MHCDMISVPNNIKKSCNTLTHKYGILPMPHIDYVKDDPDYNREERTFSLRISRLLFLFKFLIVPPIFLI